MKSSDNIVNNVKEWLSLSDDGIRSRIGPATAQEIRTVRAVLNHIVFYPCNALAAGSEDKASCEIENKQYLNTYERIDGFMPHNPDYLPTTDSALEKINI